jgi:glycosyltransferase involved in cell wall biosynthesis
LRIAILTTEYPPFTPYDGGIGTLYAALAPALAGLGHDVHVFALTFERESEEVYGRIRLHLVEPRRGGVIGRLVGFAWASSAAARLRAQGPFDIVWAPEWAGSAAFYSRRRDAGPLVTQLFTSLRQVRELSPSEQRSPLERLQHRTQAYLERRQTERSDAIIAQTDAILDWARRLWRIDGLPVRVLPSVLNVEEVRALGRGALPPGVPPGRPRVVFFGRLEHRKGLDVLLQAMRSVWAQAPEAQLVALGEDHAGMAERLRALAGSHAGRLHLLGHHPPSEVFPAVRSADIVVLPSRWENFALAALEAMALGRPTVLTSAGGAVEFCTDGEDALLVPPEDVEALALALLRLIESPELRERLGRAAARTAEGFDTSRVAPRYLSYFAEIAAAS